uniref:Large ribosomal subunit protein uL23m n=1 Tax=Meloidogyne incognita TaxID=6306 RepID=A0A914MIZ3_MELIC
MTSRIHRLWFPGDGRPRVFLPDFWIKLLEPQKVGYMRLPKNAAMFEVDLKMSRFDVREYLEKIYKFPVRDVRLRNVEGNITWDNPLDKQKRRALWKDEDKKIAFVFFKKDFVAEFPNLFTGEEDADEKRLEQMRQGNPNKLNIDFINKDRAGVGEMLPL